MPPDIPMASKIIDFIKMLVRALNSIFQQRDVQVDPRWWNIRGEPYRGAAIKATSLEDYNLAIRYDCFFENGSICHITEL
ncbi:hypothetical protein Patl1_11688 [Pistacia atlantica]|uniref:Uncharacterized protein n=1 Tax=Pistacia atlantica TaxID=434234 RepID=A0ACC1AA94_9ROSI|nr:hypothetical protein Patl1_11688 [Pistacia atlantica]